MTYLAWYDDDRKKEAQTKIDEAIERFVERYGVEPNICLVSEEDQLQHERLIIKPVHRVAKNTFWVGYEEGLVEELEPANAA